MVSVAFNSRLGCFGKGLGIRARGLVGAALSGFVGVVQGHVEFGRFRVSKKQHPFPGALMIRTIVFGGLQGGPQKQLALHNNDPPATQ